MPEASGPTSSLLVTILMVLLAFISLVLFPISELLLALYRRAVVRSMGGETQPETMPAYPPPGPTSRLLLDVVSGRDPAFDANRPGDALYGRVRQATRATASVYAVAGVAYAAVMALATGLQSETVSPVSWILLTVAFAWPAVLTVLLLAGFPQNKSWILLAYFVALVIVGQYFEGRGLMFPIMFANVGSTLIALIVRARRVRAVAPLVGAFLIFQAIAFLIALGMAGALTDVRGPDGRPVAWVENPSPALFFFLLIFCSGPALGWLALRWIGRRYARKQMSDQTITVAAIWLIFAATQSAAFAHTNALWLLAGLAAYVVFLVVSTAGFWLLRRRSAADASLAPRLLVLRVFALGRRTRRLFDAVAARWRHVGSLQLIAGPDLAMSTVEPHEFMDFLQRRLASRFVGNDQAIERALDELDLDPDHDGRFRITDFFCRDECWRVVLGRLATTSDVVLMDLRGFTAASSGCTYELCELLNVVPLERIVFVVDRSTDEKALSRILRNAWQQMRVTSPNRSAREPRISTFRETGWWGLDHEKLLRLLCDGVALSRSQPA
jgi:hypothetical protein